MMRTFTVTLMLALSAPMCTSFDVKSAGTPLDSSTKLPTPENARRNLLKFVALAPFASVALPAVAFTPTGANDGNLADLPPEAVRSYLQYRIPLQIAADFYVFELQGKMGEIQDWGEVDQLFRSNTNRGQGNPSRIERDFTNIFRILGLSMPPDEADAFFDAQLKFEKAMATISKATAGIRRDLPIEIDESAVPMAQAGWEDGRVALNEFFTVLNGVTGLKEMRPIPASGPNQVAEYGRSPARYYDLVKKTKLCQNRGGPALSQGWGKLMVAGYLQDSCGIPDLDAYFYQSITSGAIVIRNPVI
jgi:hypothetical protein